MEVEGEEVVEGVEAEKEQRETGRGERVVVNAVRGSGRAGLATRTS